MHTQGTSDSKEEVMTLPLSFTSFRVVACETIWPRSGSADRSTISFVRSTESLPAKYETPLPGIITIVPGGTTTRSTAGGWWLSVLIDKEASLPT